ncbi:hypothetical protein AB6C83_13110 [Vibrio cyclitrophicus]
MNFESNIIVYVDAIERYRFFSRLVPRKKIYFVTHLFSVYILCLKSGVDCFLIKNNYSNKGINREFDTLDDITVGPEFSTVIYDSIYNCLDEFLCENKFKSAYVWNGMRVFQRAFSDICKLHEIPTKFFEITNLPGKIQVNERGVNAQSSFRNLIKNDDIIYDELKWKIWLDNFFETSRNKKVGQVSILKRVNFWYFADRLGSLLFNTLSVEHESIIQKLIKKWKFKLYNYDIDTYSEEYIFFPLQVSTDSQILINYDGDLISALYRVSQMAKQEGLILVIKPHPAESDTDKIEEILALKSELNFFVDSSNTIDLILNSRKVVTINSTVGLESLLLGKETVFLGRSVYQGISEKELAKLILDVFIDVDYFSDDAISNDIFE